MNTTLTKDKNIIFYDGVCALCNGFVIWVLAFDSEKQFYFASQQSQLGQDVLNSHGMSASLESLVVIDVNEKVYTQSSAVFFITKKIGGFWSFLNLFSFIPRTITDFLYRLVAAYRYRVFGKYEACPLPSPEHRDRFLDLYHP